MSTENNISNLMTIAGSGVPSNYEISGDGAIEMISTDPLEEATIVSEQAAEGAIKTGMQRFRFSGEMANIHVVDWNGTAAPESPSTPEVHVDYSVPKRNESS